MALLYMVLLFASVEARRRRRIIQCSGWGEMDHRRRTFETQNQLFLITGFETKYVYLLYTCSSPSRCEHIRQWHNISACSAEELSSLLPATRSSNIEIDHGIPSLNFQGRIPQP